MKTIAAENKPSLTSGITTEVKKNEDMSIQGKQDLIADHSKKSGDTKTRLPIPEPANTIKYKKDYAVWY
jgi:hypothetical protein